MDPSLGIEDRGGFSCKSNKHGDLSLYYIFWHFETL
jgi:hypothetical protein